MKNIFVLGLFVSIALVGCSPAVEESDPGLVSDSTEQKQGTSTVTGTLVGEGAAAVLTTGDGEILNVESYTVDFTEYNGETVEVTGEYSGTTLFVDEISSVE